MKKHFWTVFVLLCAITGIVFIAIIIQLTKGDSIMYTDTETVDSPTITKHDPIVGSGEPEVLVVVYSDFACSGCAQTATALRELINDQNELPRTLVWKDFPNMTLSDQSYKAAVAAQCANKQNAFWEYHDMLMANQRFLNDDIYAEIAEELGLGIWRFNRCVNKEKTADIVDTSIAEGQALEITATPTLFINGARYTGIMTENDLAQIFQTISNANAALE